MDVMTIQDAHDTFFPNEFQDGATIDMPSKKKGKKVKKELFKKGKGRGLRSTWSVPPGEVAN
jgi:hypothetical protein